MSGFRGFGAFGGAFAPDCYLSSTGKADSIGPPLTSAEIAGYRKTYGAASADKIASVCNQTTSPRDCMGQFFLRDPFLGRPCKGDWVTYVNGKMSPSAASPVFAPPPPPPPPPDAPDNTLLYAGIGAVAVVGIGAALMLSKK